MGTWRLYNVALPSMQRCIDDNATLYKPHVPAGSLPQTKEFASLNFDGVAWKCILSMPNFRRHLSCAFFKTNYHLETCLRSYM